MVRWAWACPVLAAIGCSTPSEPASFTATHPESKMRAIFEAVDRSDPASLAGLIEQLDSDDAAVRMFAIVALERLTGDRKGYSPYAEPHVRSRALRDWVDAYESGELQVRGGGGPEGGPSP